MRASLSICLIGLWLAPPTASPVQAASDCGGRICTQSLGVTNHTWTPGTDDYSFVNYCNVPVTAYFEGGETYLDNVINFEPGERRLVNCDRPCTVRLVKEICHESQSGFVRRRH